jgi:arabinose-5-phosphate isomerase
MSQYIIRKINSKDLTHLQAISRKTFSETFAEHNTEDDLNAYLDQQLSIEQLNEEINNVHSAFYFAEENNKVIGIITDGDIRRMLNNNDTFAHLTAKDIMTKNPKTIQLSSMVTDALNILEDFSITQLIVADQEEYKGVLHLHDILKEGIV